MGVKCKLILIVLFFGGCAIVKQRSVEEINNSKKILDKKELILYPNGKFVLKNNRTTDSEGSYRMNLDTIVIKPLFVQDSINNVSVTYDYLPSDSVEFIFKNRFDGPAPIRVELIDSLGEVTLAYDYWNKVKKHDYQYLRVICNNASSRLIEVSKINFKKVLIEYSYPSRPDLYYFFTDTVFLIKNDTLRRLAF